MLHVLLSERKLDVRDFMHVTSIFKKNKLVLAVTSPLWISAATPVVLAALSYGVGVVMKENIQKNIYQRSKTECMRRWTDEVVHSFSKENNIEYFVSQNYFPMFQKSISELCDDYFPRQTAANRRLIESITNDRRTFEEIIQVYLPLQEELLKFQEDAFLFHLKYIDEVFIDADYLRIVKKHGEGFCSDVYLARKENETTIIILKARKANTHTLELGFLKSEVECLR